MIYVRGNNVFSGYLGEVESNPFELIDGKYWYKTGDLGYLDSEGYLFITGRLKRFIKIAGEMISLPFIEKILIGKYVITSYSIHYTKLYDTSFPASVLITFSKPR